MTEKLKPCPFCGNSEKLVLSQVNDAEGEWSVECHNPQCIVLGPDSLTSAIAKHKWNTRHLSAADLSDEVKRETIEAMTGFMDTLGNKHSKAVCLAMIEIVRGVLIGETK